MKENIEEDIEILENLQEEFIKLVSKKFVIEEDKRRAEITAIEHILSDYKRILKENEELREEDLMSQRALDIFDKRPFREKYLKERRAEQPNLLYPDADEIYERYYKLKEENKTLKDLLEEREI